MYYMVMRAEMGTSTASALAANRSASSGQGEVTFEPALKEDTGSMYLLIAQPLHIPETSELISFIQKR